MQIRLDRFPGGVHKALTFSYDDGVGQDRRLVDLFNRHGLKATFNLNAGLLHEGAGWQIGPVRIDRIAASEVKTLYAGHEVAAHGLTHPHLECLSREAMRTELVEDRRALEALVGYPVRGFAYPFGSYSPDVLEMLAACGFAYARTVGATHRFVLPTRPLEWDSTCHHDQSLMEDAARFFGMNAAGNPALMYVWGHSYEFDVKDNWGHMEAFCAMAGSSEGVWFATNIEVLDYVTAVRNLQFSVDGSLVRNPSAQPVWISADGESVCVAAGETLRL